MAAVPALTGLAGLAAAICLSPQALAQPPAVARQQVVITGTIRQAGLSPAQLVSASAQDRRRTAGPARSANYTVRAGDSLSSVAGRFYHDPQAWPVLYWANRGQLWRADGLAVGQMLRIPAKPARIPAAPGLPESSAPVTATASPAAAGTRAAAQATAAAYSGGTPGGSFGQCVISRESGGQSQVMNASGHYGLYQFSASTWAKYGGSAVDFGKASVAEQNQVFGNALARGGESNWSSYDGC